MGDRCYVRVDLHGEIGSIKALLEIAHAAGEENFNEVQTDTEALDWIAEAIDNDELYFEMDECNYGTVEDFESVLEEYSVSYRVYNGPGGSYGAAVKSWFAAEQTLYECNMTGGEGSTIVIEITELEHALAVDKLNGNYEKVQSVIDHANRADGDGLPKLTLAPEVQEYLAKRQAAKALGVDGERKAG